MNELLDKMEKGFQAAAQKTDDLETQQKQLSQAIADLTEKIKLYKHHVQEAYARPGDPRAVFASKAEAKEFGEIVISVLKNMPLDREKSQDSTTIAAGSVLVGEELSTRLIELMGVYGKFRGNCQIVPMTQPRLDVPKVSSDVTIYVPGQKVSITESGMTFGSVKLDVRAFAAYVGVSKELDDDSIIAIAEILARSMIRSLTKKEDEIGFLGDGSSTYNGMTGITGALKAIDTDITSIPGVKVGTGNAYSELVLGDFEGTVALLPPEFDEFAKWYMHKRFYYNVIMPLVRDEGVANFVDLISDRKARYFLGYEIEFVHCMPYVEANSQVCAILADLRDGAYLGERKNLGIERSDHVLFQNYMVAFRGVERIDINAYGVGDGTNPGPIVGLVTAAS